MYILCLYTKQNSGLKDTIWKKIHLKVSQKLLWKCVGGGGGDIVYQYRMAFQTVDAPTPTPTPTQKMWYESKKLGP